MVETPPGKESLKADFTKVQTYSELMAEVAKLPDEDPPFMAAAEPCLSDHNDVFFRDNKFLSNLIADMFIYVEASSTRQGSFAERTTFLDTLINKTFIDTGSDSVAFMAAVRRALIASFPDYAADSATVAAPATPATPAVPAISAVPAAAAVEAAPSIPDQVQALRDLGYPQGVMEHMTQERVQKVLAAKQKYSPPKVTMLGAKPAAAAAVRPGRTDLAKLLPAKPRVASPAQPAAPALTPEAATLKVFDQDPAFRTFFARYRDAEDIIQAQNTDEIEKRRRVFAMKDKLATDLYMLANSAIKGDFIVLDFDDPDSGLPANQKVEFQKYVDNEAIERPDQLLNLGKQLEDQQDLKKSIATERATLEQLGGVGVLDTAEQEALVLKRHLELAGESARRDTVFAVLPHALEVGLSKVLHKFSQWRGDQAGGDQALGERVARLEDQAASRQVVKDTYGVNLGLSNPFKNPLNYSLAWWTEHPDIQEKLESVEGAIAQIRAKKQTIEQLDRNLAETTAKIEAFRTATFTGLPPVIALVQYAQAQISHIIASFNADAAPEDLQRVFDYGKDLASRGPKGALTGAEPFKKILDAGDAVKRLHEAVVAQWGQRVFEIFTRTAISKKGAAGEMEKAIKGILKQDAIGAHTAEEKKREVVKALITQAWRNIDPKQGDGKERRVALIGVMISCGLLKKDEKITT